MPAKRASTTTAQPVPNVNSNTKNNNNATTTTPLATVPPANSASNGMSRLTPARDLTLGGRGAGAPTKKVFAPNLNAVRNKNTNVKTSKDFTQPRSGRGRGGRGAGGATRGRAPGGSANSTLIQTTGVFSEGAGAANIRKSSNSGATYTRAGEEAVATRKRNDRNDKSNDSKVRELLGDSDNDDCPSSENEIDNDKTDLAFKPVMLSEGLWHSQKVTTKPEAADITNVNTKQEDSGVAQHLEQMSIQTELEQPPPQYGRYPRSIGSFLDTTKSQLFIMQLPNVLPCVTDDADESAAASAEQPQSQADQVNNTSGTSGASIGTSKASVLQQLEEGQIGKIIRYRSGRVKLLLGETRFDLDMGLESGFLQELMSIECNREQRSGDMINLGPIQAKLKATPDWVHLFEQQEAATRQQRSTAAQLTSALDSK